MLLVSNIAFKIIARDNCGREVTYCIGERYILPIAMEANYFLWLVESQKE